MLNAIRLKLLQLLGGEDAQYAALRERDACAEAYERGERRAKTHWRVLPLPFSEDQLSGASYGEFITPRGFAADVFGECNVPACGPHGYEQVAGYVSREALDDRSGTVTVHSPRKFQLDMIDADQLVPVIVTVLR